MGLGSDIITLHNPLYPRGVMDDGWLGQQFDPIEV